MLPVPPAGSQYQQGRVHTRLKQKHARRPEATRSKKVEGAVLALLSVPPTHRLAPYVHHR
jgi:hypothetical protein